MISEGDKITPDLREKISTEIEKFEAEKEATGGYR